MAIPIVTTRNCQESNQISPDRHVNLKLTEVRPSKNRQNAPENIGTETVSDKPRNRCCPYDFDSRICKVVDDRVVCGYNTNIGGPMGNDNEVQLGNGCRMKGGRLECGYFQPPYTNPRRPPVWNDPETVVLDDNDNYNPGEDLDQGGETDRNRLSLQKNSSEVDEREKMKKAVKVSTRLPRVTRCVEIRDRIVCRDM